MSLLHRWSLPSRGFTRDKSQDSKSSDRTKFPTVHLSQPAPRRRANISSAFSTLFEKPESRRTTRNSVDRNQASADLPMPVHRTENVPLVTKSKYSHAHTYQDTFPNENASAEQGNGFGSAQKQAEVDVPKPSSYYMPGVPGQGTHRTNETPQPHPFRVSSNGTGEMDNRDDSYLESTKPTDSFGRIRSASSSYPSEGMRSPIADYRSPEPTSAARSANYLAEYRRYGRYPSQSTWQLSSTAASEGSVAGAAAPGASGTGTNSKAPGQNSSPKSSPFVDGPRDYPEPTQSDTTRSRHASTVGRRVGQQQKVSSTSDITVPILDNEDALSSQLEVSFRKFKRPSAMDMFPDGNENQHSDKTARSTDRLRRSTDTDESILTAVRHSSVSDDEDAWSTVRDTGAKPLSRPASWMHFFSSTTPHVPVNTLAQRIQTLTLHKWVKRVSFKAKARFQLVGKPIPEAQLLALRIKRRKERRGEEPPTAGGDW